MLSPLKWPEGAGNTQSESFFILFNNANACGDVTTQHPLDFVLWQGDGCAESVAYGLYVRIRASQQRRLEGKRQGVLSSYGNNKVGMRDFKRTVDVLNKSFAR